MTELGSAPTWSSVPDPSPDLSGPAVGAAELASILAGRMCHDFISPASAIVSGVDLLDDPSAADMRDDALKLIEASARKLVALLAFTRVAFGGSSSAESFDTRELKTLTEGVFNHVRAELAWDVEPESLNKPCARAVLNLAQLGAGALPTGGVARLSAVRQGADVLMALEAVGPRVRVRPEVVSGLEGRPLEDGLSGHWVQAYYLHALVTAAGGQIRHQLMDDRAVIRARCPA
jgi:histidine phosphotransferase ChpT